MEGDRHTKGVNVIDLVRTLKAAEKSGRELDLTPEERKLLDERILVSAWYPFEDFRRLIHRVHEVMGGTEEAAQQMGEFAAQQALEGVHSAFVRRGDPEGAVRALERIWPTYFDFGEARVEKVDGRLVITIEGYPDVDHVHGHLLVGWIRKAAEMAGSRPELVVLEQAPWLGNDAFVVGIELSE